MIWTMNKTTTHLPLTVLIGKWLMDKTAAIIGLSITALLFPFIALIIKLDSKGPIFYRQWRVGRAWPHRTELFQIIKFRTMKLDAEQGQAKWAQKVDPRTTRVGKWLRKSRLDELPQFYHILRGDMSLIGPRPERPAFIKQLEQHIPFYDERMYGIAPGVTGLAQVNLGYDEHIEDVRAKVAYDHAYALALGTGKTWLMTDSKILLRTIKVVILGQGQ